MQIALLKTFPVTAGKLKPNVSNFLTAMDAFSPVTKTWTALAPLPYARGSDRLVTLPSNRLLIMGGDTGDFGNGQTLVSAPSPSH